LRHVTLMIGGLRYNNPPYGLSSVKPHHLHAKNLVSEFDAAIFSSTHE
jgi:hypothetical protein